MPNLTSVLRAIPRPVANSCLWGVRRRIERELGLSPPAATVTLGAADYVVLQLSRLRPVFCLQSHLAEQAMAIELAAAGKRVAVSAEPGEVFGKRVFWSLPYKIFVPRLWDQSRQCVAFADGLEAQGNSLFTSSAEARFWENKRFMHERFSETGVRTPATTLLTTENCTQAELPEPLLLKEEHSAGSAGIYFFPTARAARDFAIKRTWMPGETLIAQQLVAGATRDLRLTLVGKTVIRSATYWRIKPKCGVGSAWISTATSNNSTVQHAPVPQELVTTVAGYLSALGLRTAGVDIMFEGDDVSRGPLILEVSPIYQPNPPKPIRYNHYSYNRYKHTFWGRQSYYSEQHKAFREIFNVALQQNLF